MYTLAVTAPGATPFTTPATGTGRIYRLFGDIDGDGFVTNLDAVRFGPNLANGNGVGDNPDAPGFDADNDGFITNLDAVAFGPNLANGASL